MHFPLTPGGRERIQSSKENRVFVSGREDSRSAVCRAGGLSRWRASGSAEFPERVPGVYSARTTGGSGRIHAGHVLRRRLASARQAACVQVGQVQSWQLHETQESLQCSHEQTLWLQVGQLQSSHVQVAQWSEQCGQLQMSHSS